MKSQQSPAGTRAAHAALGVGLAGFLALKCYSLQPHRSDEGIYFYLAQRVCDGGRLYRDLFFAHPPLHLFFPVLFTALFGYSFALLKLLPSFAGAAQGVLVFFIARRAFDSELAGCVAAYGLWFSENFLKASSYLTGINQADALFCAALLLVLYRRPLAAGLLAGAAQMTLLQVTPVVVGLALFVFLWDRRDGLLFAAGIGALLLAIHLLGAALGGAAFFEQVYLYHLNKVGSGGLRAFSSLVTEEPVLFFGGAAALGLSSLEAREQSRRVLVMLGALAVLQCALMVLRPSAFPFYFQPAFPLLALATGWAVAHGVARARRRESSPRARALGVVLAAGVILGPLLLQRPLLAALSPRRFWQNATYSHQYLWRDAPILGPLNGVIRAVWWRDVRRPGDLPFAPTEYLWNLSRGFDSYPALIAAVREESAVGDSIFGDSTSLPLVALGAGRRIAADFADTNLQRFVSGTTSPEATIAALEAAPPTLVLGAEGGFMAVPELNAWVRERYQSTATFADQDGDAYTLYRRR